MGADPGGVDWTLKKNTSRQVCIPVGCLPTTAVAISQGAGADPPPRQTDIAPRQTPLGQTHPLFTTPLYHTPPLYTTSLSIPQTLPSIPTPTPPPVGRMTESCKNITFPATRWVKLWPAPNCMRPDGFLTFWPLWSRFWIYSTVRMFAPRQVMIKVEYCHFTAQVKSSLFEYHSCCST